MMERTIHVNRSTVDADTGEFEAVLFTDGEASDGHILNIAGGKIPRRMPLFVNHWADPREQLGSLDNARKTDHEVIVRGKILIKGDGAEADIRRDILLKMAAGHVTALSGRWDARSSDAVRRTDLPEDHAAFVSEEMAAKDSRLRFGMFFKKWTALEGSIVGVGADPEATVRWAHDQDSAPHVRAFWQRQVDHERKAQEEAEAEGQEDSAEAAEPTGGDVEREDAASDPESQAPDPDGQRAAFAAYVRELTREGASLEDLCEELDRIGEDPSEEKESVAEVVLSALERFSERLDRLEQGQAHSAPSQEVEPGIDSDEESDGEAREVTSEEVEAAERTLRLAHEQSETRIQREARQRVLDRYDQRRSARQEAKTIAREIADALDEHRQLVRQDFRKTLREAMGRVD